MLQNYKKFVEEVIPLNKIIFEFVLDGNQNSLDYDMDRLGEANSKIFEIMNLFPKKASASIEFSDGALTDGFDLLELWTQIIREIPAGSEEYMIYFIIMNIFNLHLLSLKRQGKELASPELLRDLLIKLREKQQQNVGKPITQEGIDFARNHLETLANIADKVINKDQRRKLERKYLNK